MRVWFLALLLAGCFSPSYQDGKRCSAAGECPSGFTCFAGHCYRPGDEPRDLSVATDDLRRPDLGVDDLATPAADLASPADLTAPPPDLSPVVVSAPPPGFWLSSGGGSVQSSSGDELNVSLGEIGLTGNVAAPSQASVELGLFASGIVQ